MTLINKVVLRTTGFIKETIPILLPAFIIYVTYDVLRHFQIGLDDEQPHFLHSWIDFDRYSVLEHGFKPALEYLMISRDSALSTALNALLYLTYVLATTCALGYTLLFHLVCLISSYDRKWKTLHNLVSRSLKSASSI